jgi:hypothetical protein
LAKDMLPPALVWKTSHLQYFAVDWWLAHLQQLFHAELMGSAVMAGELCCPAAVLY